MTIKDFSRLATALFLCSAILYAGATQVYAEEPAESQQRTESVIRGQLEAMAQGDGAGAYSYAAPNIQDIFPSPDIFMAMVRDGYGALIAPSDYAFEHFEVRDDRAIQVLNVLDQNGRQWRAIYRMQRLEDGTWRIAGCMIEEIQGGNV